MQTTTASSPYTGFRFPAEIISYAVWLSFRFSLSYRDVEELLFERGIAAKWEILPGVEHRQHRYLNSRAENSHQPTRQREQTMRRFKSAGQAQRFLAAHGPILSPFRPRRHQLKAQDSCQKMAHRHHIWREMTATAVAA
jgi:transposase-like protein